MARAGALIAVALTVAACDASRRPQLVITVRTDLALPEEVSPDGPVSPAALIDQVRAEVLGADGSVQDTRDFVLRGAPFPITFGVAPAAAGPRVRVRITGFRSSWSSKDKAAVPSRGVSVERLLVASVVAFRTVDVTLRGDCIGRPSDLAKEKTCVDATHVDAEAIVSDDANAATSSWAAAKVVACNGTAPADMVCIRGGASAIGDPALVVVDPNSDAVPAPPRMVVVAPFFMDKTEVTVARMRALVDSGTFSAPPPTSSAVDPKCNMTATPGAAEKEAVRCVSFETARAACKAWGGDLPTASQWEHAARGRGLGTRYPWGDEPPTCCAADLATGALGCKAENDVGAHANPDACAGVADVSRDGVLDLGGSAREWVLDAPVSFDACLPSGVLFDATCADATGVGSTKGGSFATPLERATLAERRSGASNVDVGFRCVRPAR